MLRLVKISTIIYLTENHQVYLIRIKFNNLNKLCLLMYDYH